MIARLRGRSIIAPAFAIALMLPLMILFMNAESALASDNSLVAVCNHVWVFDEDMSYPASYDYKGMKVWYCENCLAERVKYIPKKKKTKAIKMASKPIVQLYKYAKTYDVGKMSKCFKKKPKGMFFEKMRYLANICRKQNSKEMDCELLKARVGKKKAQFKVAVCYRSGYDAFCDALGAYYEAGTRYALKHYSTPSGSWLDAQLKKQIEKSVKKIGFYETDETFNITVVKTSSGWKIAKTSKAIVDSVNCDYESAWRNTDA